MPLNIVHSIMRQPLFMSYNFNALELGSLFSTATAGLCETFVREKCCFYLLVWQNKYKMDSKTGNLLVLCQSRFTFTESRRWNYSNCIRMSELFTFSSYLTELNCLVSGTAGQQYSSIDWFFIGKIEANWLQITVKKWKESFIWLTYFFTSSFNRT